MRPEEAGETQPHKNYYNQEKENPRTQRQRGKTRMEKKEEDGRKEEERREEGRASLPSSPRSATEGGEREKAEDLNFEKRLESF
jgi:hypothetical protein